MSEVAPLALGAVVFLAVSVGVYVGIVISDERARVRAALRAVEGYETETLRERELETPFVDRVLAPLRRGLAELGRRAVPSGYLERVQHKLVLAGRPSPEDLDRFRAVRIATLAAAPALFVVALAIVPPPAEQRFAVALLLLLAAVFGPDAVLNRQVEERQESIRRSLPDLLDLLTISVEAGLGFEQAVNRTVIAVPGPLAAEFSRALGEIQAGAGRAEALRHLDERVEVPEVRSFVLALIQAERFGVSVARVLRNQADEMRVKRRQHAQERAQKAQVKMLIPMVLCIFPAFFVVLLGPAVIQVSRSL